MTSPDNDALIMLATISELPPTPVSRNLDHIDTHPDMEAIIDIATEEAEPTNGTLDDIAGGQSGMFHK